MKHLLSAILLNYFVCQNILKVTELFIVPARPECKVWSKPCKHMESTQKLNTCTSTKQKCSALGLQVLILRLVGTSPQMQNGPFRAVQR
jgi:hypothetical protein